MSVKAYELVPSISKFASPGDKNAKIDCIECCGRYIFIGTSDGYILKYIVQETGVKHDSDSPFLYQKEGQHAFDSKKPVRIMKAASALEKLIVLCDTVLFVLSLNSLEETGTKLKNIQTFCVNENPTTSDPFLVQICVAPVSKSQVAVYNVTIEDKLVQTTSYSLPEPAKSLGADCSVICAALRSKYVIVDCDLGLVQDLFPFDKDGFASFICRVAKEEFLVSGPDGLGIFVCSGGTSTRPPLQWSYPLTSLAFHHPYILGVSNEIIMIHSIVDQQQKQAIPFVGGQIIGNYDGHIYVCSPNELNALVPIPWEKQVEVLLLDEHVEEALALLEKMGPHNRSVGHVDPLKRRFKQQAAFIYFARSELEVALDLFLDSEVDERELISLFPGLLPSSTSFVRAVPPLHSIADISQLYHGDGGKIQEAKQFLLHFLQMAHDSRKSLFPLEIDTALVKLYAELGQNKELEALLESNRFKGDFQCCNSWLKSKSLHHARALLMLQNGKQSEALSLWCQLISGEVLDSNFKGVSYFAQILKNMGNPDLLWQYADLVLDSNEEEGVELFLQDANDHSKGPVSMNLDPNTVANYLQRYPNSLILYLEHLINDGGNEEEKFHTQLAVQYVDRISKLKTSGIDNQRELDENILRLRKFLIGSSQYRAQFLLPKVRDLGLDQEVALLYGKMGDHDKALSILVRQLRDFKAAEEYCLINGGKNSNAPNLLLNTLLAIYLDPKLSGVQGDDYLEPALELLNKHASQLDPIKAIEIIPDQWSVSILESFLQGALRSSMTKFRINKMEKSLAKADSIQKTVSLYDLERHSLKLMDSNYCCVCKKPFTDMKFARYPNDVVTHVECGRLANVCPLTGRCFSLLNDTQSRR
ncbi:transforming growth factor-beta receptor-associated protein 1-like [Thrips palmi]|uniref:Transforming growth factor-beta receptor-associated protein 1-like n=1 Tax=Thrips palmi TaxID=161013 RepID=A0A6P8Z294_THRPL|nr:transforming growth factor-beta receptor-associated protein 1-like [Thrips palmi]